MMDDLSGAGVSPSIFCFMGLVFMGLVLADQSPFSVRQTFLSLADQVVHWDIEK